MRKSLSCLWLTLAALSLCTAPVQARGNGHARHHAIATHPVPDYQSTNDLGLAVKDALDATRHGKSVLVVFDIDNTLLTLPQDLGGDIWYNWQKSQEDPAQPQQFNNLLANDAMLLQIADMVPTQPDVAPLIKSLQSAHIAVYALSARGPNLRGATETAFSNNDIDLSSAPECTAPLCSRRGHLRDAEIKIAVAKANLPPLKDGKLYRDITVSDGLMMVSGQNKGLMLHLLLDSLKTHYSDVYFVDDTLANVQAVRDAAPRIRASIHPYSYTRLWPTTADFASNTARQTRTASDLTTLKTGLCAAIQAKVCNQPVLPAPKP